jgi:hypothetical protein
MLSNGMWRMSELSDYVPNLVVQDSIGSAILSIRGLATLGFLNPSFEMSTGMFQDGVYMGKTRQSANHFLDVERIEVLRGPQPTYFGQGAIAGAITVRVPYWRAMSGVLTARKRKRVSTLPTVGRSATRSACG